MRTIKIREVLVEDAPRLLEIYSPYVSDTSISFEYAIPELHDFSHQISIISQSYPYIVAEMDGYILGYAYATKFKEREAFKWTCETSIYVDSIYRNRGIGNLLYTALEKELVIRGYQSMCACIAYTDDIDDPHLGNDSIYFHEKMGFKKVAHFHKCGWKFSKWYDIVWMEKLL